MKALKSARAGRMPFDPDLYADGVHTTYPGTRMKGWVILQQLVPPSEARLMSGAWPKPQPARDTRCPGSGRRRGGSR